MWNICRTNYTSQDSEIRFNELYNLNLKFKKIKEKYKKYEYDMKAHVSDVLPEEFKPVRVYGDLNI